MQHRRSQGSRTAGASNASAPPPGGNKPQTRCFRCNKSGHAPASCWAKQVTCNFCKNKGHIKAACRKFARSQKGEGNSTRNSTNYVTDNTSSNVSSGSTNDNNANVNTAGDAAYSMYQVGGSRRVDPILVTVLINDSPVVMEVDTGSGDSIISEDVFHSQFGGPEVVPLSPLNYTLYTYTQQPLQILGEIQVQVVHNDQTKVLPLIVVKGKGTTLLGRLWLNELQLDWKQVHRVNSLSSESVTSQHKPLFAGDLGTLKGHKVHIAVEPDARPKFCKARPVPFAYKAKVETELKRLESKGVLERVTFSKWASP